jgi:hypothetical protein
MRQAYSFAAFTLAIILLGAPVHSQSVPSSQVSANDLARRVITNELKFHAFPRETFRSDYPVGITIANLSEVEPARELQDIHLCFMLSKPVES